MAIKGTLIFTRPNTGVAWYEPTDEQKATVKAAFGDTGLRTSSAKNIYDSETISADGLKKTWVYTFANSDAKSAWVDNETVQSMLNDRDTYNVANNIDMERSEEEV